MIELQRVTKLEAMNFLMPILRAAAILGTKYEVRDKEIVIPIPKFLPIIKIKK